MKTVTLRNIDEPLEKALMEKIKEQGTSLNSAVLGLLKESLGLTTPKRRVRKSDLDDLAGTWSKEELSAFNEATADFETIDEELWK